jgi:sulfoxide reductase heme-binding subunit YedZ
MNAIDLSADVGLIAIILASVNICVGVLIAVRYSPVRCWPHLRLNIFRLHNRTAYLLVVAIILHPVILLFDGTTHFRWADIVLPVWSPVQPLENTLGALGFYLILVVVVTSYFRLRLTRSTWKRFHYLVYVAGIAVFAHSLLADPHLKGQVDFLEGEKLLVEFCGVVTLAFGIYGVKRKRNRLRELRGASIAKLRDDREQSSLGTRIGKFTNQWPVNLRAIRKDRRLHRSASATHPRPPHSATNR